MPVLNAAPFYICRITIWIFNDVRKHRIRNEDKRHCLGQICTPLDTCHFTYVSLVSILNLIKVKLAHAIFVFTENNFPTLKHVYLLELLNAS